MAAQLQFTTIADLGGGLSEGPLWDPDTSHLWWTDIQGGCVYRYDPEDGIETVTTGKNVGGFALDKNGGLTCACLDGLYRWNEADGFRLLARDFAGNTLRFNDVTVDARGRFLCGSAFCDPDKPFESGKLFSVGGDGSIAILEEDLLLSNGIGFSTDSSTLYVTDSVRRLIYAYDYDLESGTVANRREFVKVGESEGIPDGLTVDSEGFVWSAQWYGACVVRYDQDGVVERRIDTPMKQTSSVMFGGKEMDELFITTAGPSWRSPWAPPGYDFDVPNIGGPVYSCRPGVQGVLEHKTDIQYETNIQHES